MREQLRILNALASIALVAAHARLIDPPSRSSMWRFGFNTPVNYNDNELFCGGLNVQYYTNHGRCGVCGDDFNLPQPRPNEAGGKYAKGIIVRTYSKGQIINITIDVTANHLGYFVFHICPHNNPKKIVSQDCLDKYPLLMSNSRTYRYYVKQSYLGPVTFPVILPKDIICTQCVIQWQYRGKNNWGKCKGGREGLGCGPQETFRACADVAITDGSIDVSTETTSVQRTSSPSTHTDMKISKQPEIAPNPPAPTETSTPTPSSNEMHSTRAIQTPRDDSGSLVLPTTDNGIFKQNCKGIQNMLRAVPGLDYWCQVNCVMGNCPHNLCQC